MQKREFGRKVLDMDLPVITEVKTGLADALVQCVIRVYDRLNKDKQFDLPKIKMTSSEFSKGQLKKYLLREGRIKRKYERWLEYYCGAYYITELRMFPGAE